MVLLICNVMGWVGVDGCAIVILFICVVDWVCEC